MVKNVRDTALFGGSFDPPHLGHREIIRKLLELPEIRQVVVVPAWLNPFKERSHAPAKKRLEWCRRAFDLPNVIVSDYEIRRGRPVYSIETYRALSREFPIGYLVVGADNLPTIEKWKEFETLNRELTWIVATREGSTPDRSMLQSSILLPVHIPVSSTAIRRGEGTEYLDPRIREEVRRFYPSIDAGPINARKETE
ncbi:nicotinate (nicotinamide) nucleotide adenylyltransferase [Nitratifractor sp.]